MESKEFYEIRVSINTLIRFCRNNEAYSGYEESLLKMEEQVYHDQGFPSPAEETAGLGTKGIRDPLAPCERFDPREQVLGDFADCETDGHYLCGQCCYKEESKERREVKPAKLPRFPRFAVCPSCGKGGEGDMTVCSYVNAGMPEDSPRFIGCGYCRYNGPAPDHPLYPREGKHN